MLAKQAARVAIVGVYVTLTDMFHTWNLLEELAFVTTNDSHTINLRNQENGVVVGVSNSDKGSGMHFISNGVQELLLCKRSWRLCLT